MIDFLRAPLGAICGLGLLTGVAFASPAILLSDSVLQKGPGAGEPPALALKAGTHVDVRRCEASAWCLVERRGKQGWVEVDALDLYPGRDGITTRQDAAEAERGARGGAANDPYQTERSRRIAVGGGGNGGENGAGPGGSGGSANKFADRQRDSLSRGEPAPLPGLYGSDSSSGTESLATKIAGAESAADTAARRNP